MDINQSLSLSSDDISKLSTDDLLKLHRELKNFSKNHNLKQYSLKICLNSIYGASACVGYRYYDVRLAASITAGGRLAIKYAEKYINLYLNKLLNNEKYHDYVVFAHTDSLYIVLDDYVKKILGVTKTHTLDEKLAVTKQVAEFCDKTIQPLLLKVYSKLSAMMNAYDNRMEMKLEHICSSAMWADKKNRYSLLYLYKEGVFLHEPKLKSVGSEAIRANTPKLCRNALKKILWLILDGTESEVHQFVKQFREEYFAAQLEDIAIPVSCNGLNKYSDSQGGWLPKTPSQVKGAIIHNRLLKESDHESSINLIHEGDKIKFLYLTTPNKLRIESISFINKFPSVLLKEETVDRKLMFEKNFLIPAQRMLEVPKWTTNKINKLFFI